MGPLNVSGTFHQRTTELPCPSLASLPDLSFPCCSPKLCIGVCLSHLSPCAQWASAPVLKTFLEDKGPHVFGGAGALLMGVREEDPIWVVEEQDDGFTDSCQGRSV